jgi:hypothetical protein
MFAWHLHALVVICACSNFKKLFNNFRETKDLVIGTLPVCMSTLSAVWAAFPQTHHRMKFGDIEASRNRQRTKPIIRMISQVLHTPL